MADKYFSVVLRDLFWVRDFFIESSQQHPVFVAFLICFTSRQILLHFYDSSRLESWKRWVFYSFVLLAVFLLFIPRASVLGRHVLLRPGGHCGYFFNPPKYLNEDDTVYILSFSRPLKNESHWMTLEKVKFIPTDGSKPYNLPPLYCCRGRVNHKTGMVQLTFTSVKEDGSMVSETGEVNETSLEKYDRGAFFYVSDCLTDVQRWISKGLKKLTKKIFPGMSINEAFLHIFTCRDGFVHGDWLSFRPPLQDQAKE